jgi:hypothetical protein
MDWKKSWTFGFSPKKKSPRFFEDLFFTFLSSQTYSKRLETYSKRQNNNGKRRKNPSINGISRGQKNSWTKMSWTEKVMDWKKSWTFGSPRLFPVHDLFRLRYSPHYSSTIHPTIAALFTPLWQHYSPHHSSTIHPTIAALFAALWWHYSPHHSSTIHPTIAALFTPP